MARNRLVTVTDADTGKGLEKFIFNLYNIRSLRGFLKGLWDLSVYDDCFPKRNRLGDIDGQVEIEGHVLQVEFKESLRAGTRGQELKAIRMAKHCNITTVFVYGKQDQPEYYSIYKPEEVKAGNLKPDIVPANTAAVKKVFRDWAKWATENSLVENRAAEWDAVSLASKVLEAGEK